MKCSLNIYQQNYYPYTEYAYDERGLHSQQLSYLNDFLENENQLPTHAEFLTIIEDYLNNLSPKKRDKALVDENRYFLIQQVLKDPRNTSVSTAQFRFWVKKMFTIKEGTTDIVCHDNKPVAVKENIYGILVKAHQNAHHGGRDKTSALVRKQYSWIPKELVARFVRQCPFCIVRRNGGHSPGTCAPKTPSPHTGYSTQSNIGFDPLNSNMFSLPEGSRREVYSDASSSCKTTYTSSPTFPTTPNSSTLLRPFYESFNYNSNNDGYLQNYQYGLPVQQTAQPHYLPTDYIGSLNYHNQNENIQHPPQNEQKKQFQFDRYLHMQQPIQEWYHS